MGQVEDLQVEYLMHEMHTAECWMSEAQERISKIPILSSYDNFLYYPVFDNRLGYCDFETIQKYQEEDERLQKALQTNPCLFAKQIDNCRIICTQPNNDEWKIVLTDELLPRIVKWYHEFLIYTEGGERLYRTLARHFVHPRLRSTALEHVANCKVRKRMVTGHRENGQLAPRQTISAPWEEVHVDCIGNWSFKVSKTVSLNVRALTMIDPVTNLLEIKQLFAPPTAQSVMKAFELGWLCRYPKPVKVICNRGPEFLGHEFPQKLLEAGIRLKPISALNPQSNGIIERVHQVIAQILRTLIDKRKPKTDKECRELVEDGLSFAMHATRAAGHSQLDFLSPSVLAFNRDMILNIPYQANLLLLQQHRQKKIDNRLIRANAKRSFIDYQPGMMVYVLTARKSKLDPVYEGPFEIMQTHTNGTVTIRLANNVVDRVNIRQLKL